MLFGNVITNYHGHNYELIVGVTGHRSRDRFMDVKILSDLIKEEVENRFDHKNLNLDVLNFKILILQPKI
jgi:6-pyruvoyltetrahydropterin/6-carboxytetrahydropterin synthase